MGQNRTEAVTSSGIKVLDRAVTIMLTVAEQPRSLSELCEATNLPRATAHRLASALEAHHIFTRTSDGRWTVGPVFTSLGSGNSTKLIDAAAPIMNSLVTKTLLHQPVDRLVGRHPADAEITGQLLLGRNLVVDRVGPLPDPLQQEGLDRLVTRQ